MSYVIKGGSRNQYVSKQGSLHSYTPKLENARKFSTRAEAEQNKCGNESVLSLEEATS